MVSMGRAHEAMAASMQQMLYTDRVRYTEDSNITCRKERRNAVLVSLCEDLTVFQYTLSAKQIYLILVVVTFTFFFTCATKGVMRAPTLAIPLLVPRPNALVAVG